jgi:hypothetical protein
MYIYHRGTTELSDCWLRTPASNVFGWVAVDYPTIGLQVSIILVNA